MRCNIEDAVADIKQRPCRAKLLVARNFNADLEVPEEHMRDEVIMSDLATAILEDMSAHLLPRSKAWLRDRQMWIMLRRNP